MSQKTEFRGTGEAPSWFSPAFPIKRCADRPNTEGARSGAPETQPSSCPGQPCGAGAHLITKTICPLRAGSIHARTEQRFLGGKGTRRLGRHLRPRVDGHTFTYGSHSGASAVSAEFPCCLRIRQEVPFVWGQVGTVTTPALSYERELTRHIQVGIY